jgi:hypothetical protein
MRSAFPRVMHKFIAVAKWDLAFSRGSRLLANTSVYCLLVPPFGGEKRFSHYPQSPQTYYTTSPVRVHQKYLRPCATANPHNDIPLGSDPVKGPGLLRVPGPPCRGGGFGNAPEIGHVSASAAWEPSSGWQRDDPCAPPSNMWTAGRKGAGPPAIAEATSERDSRVSQYISATHELCRLKEQVQPIEDKNPKSFEGHHMRPLVCVPIFKLQPAFD